MKKRLPALVLALAFVFTMVAACANGDTQQPTADEDTDLPEVILTMGSWRPDDVDQMNALLAKYNELVPNVTILFQPTRNVEYNDTLRLQLETGTGPDLFYSRSYATGLALFEEGFAADVSDIPGLMENFTAANLEPWQAPGGEMFAVPFAAVSHAVYYNRDIFAEFNLSVPNTWDEFMEICRTLLDNDVLPLANGIADGWDILECFFLGMLPNYIGGPEQRAQFERGERDFTDPAFIDALTDMAMVAEFLPRGFEASTYDDMMAMFELGMAAMAVDGSWTLGVYEDAEFEWGVFAIPARNAADTAITFHPDMAIAKNAATAHPDEVRAFLEWLSSREGATIASENLPLGFFPMINFPIALDNPQANEFLALNEGRVTDARFVWPALMDLYDPMLEAINELLRGNFTPEEAANYIQAAR